MSPLSRRNVHSSNRKTFRVTDDRLSLENRELNHHHNANSRACDSRAFQINFADFANERTRAIPFSSDTLLVIRVLQGKSDRRAHRLLRLCRMSDGHRTGHTGRGDDVAG